MSQLQLRPPRFPENQKETHASASLLSHGNGVTSNDKFGVAEGNGAQQQISKSLYVGDLHESVTHEQLANLFGKVGNVQSVRVCTDLVTGRSLGYAYVNFTTAAEASKALETLNFTPLNGKSIRIMFSHRDPSIRKSGAGNIFIKNIDKGIDNKALYDTFSAFGMILSCKVATDSSGKSKGYGFVQFDTEESADKAIQELNGMLINEKQIYVGPFVKSKERKQAKEGRHFSNIYIKNLSDSISEEDLQKEFSEFGKITSAVVMRDSQGKSKGFGFVNFQNSDDAAKAVQAMNGKIFDDKEWYVGRAQKKNEREAELKEKFEQLRKERNEKLQGVNLYVKNLDDSIDDEKLKELFTEYGPITSCKVMRDLHGQSRGSGFVAFSSAEVANRAVAGLNNKMIVSKPLYVALAERKEDRKARLEAKFSANSMGFAPSMTNNVPVYPARADAIGQQLVYGRGSSPQLFQQQINGYALPQLVRGLRPGGGQGANGYISVVQAGPNIQWPSVQAKQPQSQYQRPALSYSSHPLHVPSQRNDSQKIPGTLNFSSFSTEALSTVQLQPLATKLANATPEQRRNMLGESLYPLVEQLEHNHAAKVTGMLLEIDETEVLHLIESPEALKAMVSEAMDVLRDVPQRTGSTEQLAALCLNDSIVA